MEKRLILRGLLAGAAAGLCAWLFARIFAEPAIQAAIDYETDRDAAQELLDRAAGRPVSDAEPELFSRTLQANIGSAVGMLAFGAAVGALFAVGYAICLGRVGALRPRPLALLVAAVGFVSLYLVPFVKYPANPPSVGHAATIGQRSGLYVALVLCSVAFAAGALWLGRRLHRRYGAWTATLLAIAGYLLAVGVLMALLPALGELPDNRAQYGHFATETPQPLRDSSGAIVFPGFPADVLVSFRFAALGAQALLWAVLAVVFAPLADRLLRPPATAATAEPDELVAA